jgi:hypothetical protein
LWFGYIFQHCYKPSTGCGAVSGGSNAGYGDARSYSYGDPNEDDDAGYVNLSRRWLAPDLSSYLDEADYHVYHRRGYCP